MNLKNIKIFQFFKFNLENYKKLNNIFKKNKIKIIFHFAAQAGVTCAIISPRNYINSNINA